MKEESRLQGAVRQPSDAISPTLFDEAHGVTAASNLVWRLAAEAFGEDYPEELQPWGGTTWWVLGRCIGGLRVGPGHVLVDLACGRGGPGLWLARATGAELIGIDWSPVAVEAAKARASTFIPPGKAHFQQGDLADTGLRTSCADAVLCLDAIFFAEDRLAALREARRLLRPHGRYVFTGLETDTPSKPQHVRDWTLLAEAAGLSVESKEVVPSFAEQVGRMYELWLENFEALRADIGDAAAQQLKTEAETVGSALPALRAVLVVARRPAA